MTNLSLHLECRWISAVVPQGLVRRIFGSLLATPACRQRHLSSSGHSQIYFVDVEVGRHAVCRPGGQSLLIDTGWSGNDAAMPTVRGCGQKGSD